MHQNPNHISIQPKRRSPCTKSPCWEQVEIEDWHESELAEENTIKDYDADHFLIKEEIMPDGVTKLILREKSSGKIIRKVVD